MAKRGRGGRAERSGGESREKSREVESRERSGGRESKEITKRESSERSERDRYIIF